MFLGHPVVADSKDVKLTVSWEHRGIWFVEAHNPTEKPIKAHLTAAGGWDVFAFDETADLPAGTSKVWHVKTKE
jgi:hypothetical protein